MEDAERFEPRDVEDWSEWLAHNHDVAGGVWLVTPRHSSSHVTVDYESAVTEALRYGWIDSTIRSLDSERGMQWFSPRRANSAWAASNKRRIERLRAEGRLEPAGEAAVRLAQENGSWSMYDDVERLVVPDDLAAALSDADAREAWDSSTPSARRLALAWIVQAKRAPTRERRVAATVDRVSRGQSPTPG